MLETRAFPLWSLDSTKLEKPTHTKNLIVKLREIGSEEVL
jgi:hypothetical protein